MSDRCELPSKGWWCSRDKGHEGPCAARPIQEPDPETAFGKLAALMEETATVIDAAPAAGDAERRLARAFRSAVETWRRDSHSTRKPP